LTISEVYGGGGNTNAPYDSDFVELHNTTGTARSLTGLSIQYASGAGTSWGVKILSGVIAANAYWLVKFQGNALGFGSALPAPDDTSSAIQLSATAGKVALMGTTTACTTTCVGNPAAIDVVGYGAATSYEGTGPAPAPSNTLSIQRLDHGLTDTNDNTADFQTTAPDPQNSSSDPYSPDADPPTGMAIGALQRFQTALAATVSWSATDVGSGVAGYTVSTRTATTTADFAADVEWQTDVSATSDTWSGNPGETTCFKVKARDAKSNVSGFSGERCLVIPLDDVTLTRKSFTTVVSTGTYGGSVSKATVAGAKLSSAPVTGKQLALIVTKCPTCGKVKVLWKGVSLGTFSLVAPTTKKRQVITIPASASVQTGVVSIVVTTSGKPVSIDGLAVSRN